MQLILPLLLCPICCIKHLAHVITNNPAFFPLCHSSSQALSLSRVNKYCNPLLAGLISICRYRRVELFACFRQLHSHYED